MKAQLKRSGISYEIVTAVDGLDLDLDDPETAAALASSYRNSDWFQATRAGCAPSHLSVYRRILADGLDQALILEDDVTLPDDLAALLDALSGHLSGAEVALLNFDSVQPCKVSREGSVDLPSARQLVVPVDVSQPMSAAAYVITMDACQRMDKSRLPIRSKTDDWEFFYREGILDRLRCVVPLAVTKAPHFASTIAHYSEHGFKARALVLIARYRLRPLQRALAYRRERIWRKYTRVSFVEGPPLSIPRRSAEERPPD
jgi:glycosyl transferase family 25